MRRPFFVGNWKMHFTSGEAAKMSEELLSSCNHISDLDIGVAPATTSLAVVARVLKGTKLFVAAQNCHWEAAGAYTGEVSAEMVKELGCTHVILGHSERRQLFGETDRMINRKLQAAHRVGLLPIACIGENLEQREAGSTMQVVSHQLKEAFRDLPAKQAIATTVAYEPIWAIGTGKTATSQQAQDVHEFLRDQISQMYDKQVADQIRIQYGGSVKPDNIAKLMAQQDIDGALVGGASLQLSSFLGILGYRAQDTYT